ncbi:MAG: XdhC family protein [Calditrichaceae bacterium]
MEIYKKILELENSNQPFAVATVIQSAGSTPGKVGFKMVIESSGLLTGTVGGGELEQEVVREAKSRLLTKESGTQEYILSKKPENSEKSGKATIVPMSCNGRISIFYEIHGRQETVYIFGGGHVGQALLYHLAPLGYHTILIDNRPEFASEAKNPYAADRVLSDYIEFTDQFNPDSDAFVIILTHGHEYDYQILKHIYKRNLKPAYIGLIASKSKAFTIMEKLRKDFGDKVDTGPLFTPVGLKIGGSSAAEIGLAIAAEMQSVRYGKTLIPGDKIKKTNKIIQDK